MRQETLFRLPSIKLDKDICANRHGGVDTSVQASSRVKKERDRRLVLGYVQASRAYGITLDEACVILEREPNQISGRFTELAKAGMILATDGRRLTRTGSPARVWVAI